MQFSYITTFFALAASMAMANPVPAEVSDLEDRQSSGRCCATGYVFPFSSSLHADASAMHNLILRLDSLTI